MTWSWVQDRSEAKYVTWNRYHAWTVVITRPHARNIIIDVLMFIKCHVCVFVPPPNRAPTGCLARVWRPENVVPIT